MKEETVRKEKNRKQYLLILLLLLIIGVLAALLLQNQKKNQKTYETEVAAKLGQLEGKSEAEIQEELNRVVEEGMFHIAINSDPVFPDGASEGSLEIENVQNNRYLMRVEILDGETHEVLYESKYIEPNSHIQKAALKKELEAGDYPAVAVFYAYDPESLTEMGSTACQITVHILN